VSPTTTDADADADADPGAGAAHEVVALRARLAALEAEHAEQIARLQAALARAQERAYWLDRWHVDLNRSMTTPWGRAARATVRVLRTPVRIATLVRRQLRGR
jgi:hypothetical protein